MSDIAYRTGALRLQIHAKLRHYLQRDFDLELDMSSIPVTQRNLNFSAKVLTSSLNFNEDIEFTLLPLRAVADITVSG
jgi:hypothetical protein